MTIQVDNSQGSNQIYGDTTLITTIGIPWVGMPVCASTAVSNALKCGSVQDASVVWSDTNGVTGLHGGDVSMTFVKGDSGSPLYNSAAPSNSAVGVIATTSGKFAIVRDSLDAWGYSIRNY